MFEKQGKFYADWRDRTGTRKRKAFTSARAALKFEREQKELAHPKQNAKGNQSPIPFSRKHRAVINPPSAPRPRSSSPRRVLSIRANSPRPSSKRPTTC
jgi:hypothetical protein